MSYNLQSKCHLAFKEYLTLAEERLAKLLTAYLFFQGLSKFEESFVMGEFFGFSMPNDR